MADESSQRYYWDSFDLNNEQGSSCCGVPTPSQLPKLSEIPTNGDITPQASNPHHVSTLPPPGKPVDPTRDIDTLNEEESRADVISTADTEDEPQLGSVFPQQQLTKSFEELLNLNDGDINFADDDDEENVRSPAHNVNSVHNYHLNNYLPTYNVSETDTDEHTPMLGQNRAKTANMTLDTNSDLNASIAALPELETNKRNGNTEDDDQLCELEETDDETPTVEIKPMPPLGGNHRVTQV